MIGSVKTNIGHLEAAAGIAGLIKVALSSSRRLLPPSLHFHTPNPHIDFDGLRLRVQTRLTSWPQPDEPHVAGINSFGFGGTNCHLIVQAFGESRPHVLPFSAATDAALRSAAGEAARLVAGAGDLFEGADLCRRAAAALDQSPVRAALVFTSASGLRRRLEALAAGQRVDGLAVGDGSVAGRLVFVCSGHGSQWRGMARSWLHGEPVFRARLEECTAAIEAVAGWNVIDELVADPAVSRVERYDLAQPLVFAIQVSLAALWRAWGVEPDAVIGHSMGEVAAACIAGALTLDDAALVICHRSRLLAQIAVGQPSVAILGLDRDEVERRIGGHNDRLWVAACNGPATTAVSGDPVLLQSIVASLQAEHVFARLANVDVPVHSPFVEPLRAELFESIRGIRTRPTVVPMYSTVTAAPVSGGQLGPSYWLRNLREPVLFAQAVEAALRDGCDRFVELGPHPVLAAGVEQTLARAGREGVVTGCGRRGEDERRVMREAAARLFASGQSVNWDALAGGRESDHPAEAATGQDGDYLPFVFSGHAAAGLRDRARTLSAFVQQQRDVSLLDVAYTSARRRTPLEHRGVVVARSRAELADRLEAFARGEDRPATSSGRAKDTAPRVAFTFCGQGSQWWGMGRELASRHPAFRDALAECDALIRRDADWSLIEELGRDERTSRVDQLEIAQPAVFAIQVALVALWREWGVVPDVVIGHSMGEVAAAHAAGVLTLADAVRVIVQRGRLVQQVAGRGRMAAVELGFDAAAALIEPYGDRLAIAAINGPLATVLSGEPDAIAALLRTLEAAGTFARELRVDFASHCAQMDPLMPELAARLDGITPSPAAVPIYSTVKGAAAEGWEFDASYWARNTREPVRFASAFDRLLQDGVDCVVEIGPHPVLAGAMLECARERGASPLILPSLRREQSDGEVMLGSAGALHAIGYDIDWRGVLSAGGACVALPGYPWQRERHWIGPVNRSASSAAAGSADGAAAAVAEASERIEDWLYDVTWEPAAHAPTGGDVDVDPAELHDLAAADGTALPQAAPAPQADVDQLALAYIAAAFRPAGLTPGQRVSSDDVARRLGVVPAQRRLLERVLQILSQQGVLTPEGKGWIVARVPSRVDEAGLSRALRDSAPGYSAELTLLDRCGSALPGVLRGEIDALDLLFPDGSMAEAERLYQHSPFSRGGNRQIRSVLRAFVGRRPSNRVLRVLEIGAGTGATTAHVLESLPEGRVQFVFTDASPVFLAGAKEKFASRPDIRYELLDIERPAVDQGFERGSYDVVVAANVLHATADLRATVENARSLLAGGGLLVLLEGIRPQPWIDLVFGLTSGWWRFADEDLRPSHPLLSESRWLQLLGEAGFVGAAAWKDPGDESLFAQAVLVARMPAAVPERPAHMYLCEGRPGRSDAGVDEVEAAALVRCADVVRVVRQLSAEDAPARLWIVTRGAQPVNGGSPVSVDQAPLWGLARVLALEHPRVWGGILDLDPAVDVPDGTTLAELIASAGGEDQLAVRGSTLLAARLTPAPIDQGGGAALRLRGDATYLITGGLGNLGLKVARRLVARGARRLVLTGRHAADGPAVEAIRALGSAVEVIATDVGDAASVDALMTRLASGAPLRGIVHAAGVSVRRPLNELDDSAFRADFAPKVRGAWLLHRATAAIDLDFFVMFSSAAGIWGSQDMGSYAAANHFLDALAHERRREGLPALSVNWGRWDEVGVTTPDAYEFWNRIGLQPMAESRALDALERVMASGAIERTIGRVEWSRFLSLQETKSVRPFFRNVRPVAQESERAVASARVDVGLVDLESGSPEQRLARITARVQREVCSILGIDPTRAMDQDRGFAQMGLDSLMAIELRNRLQKAVGRTLPSPVVFNYPTVRALGAYLAARPGSQTSPASRPAAPTALPVLDASAVDGLSDEEAEALLAVRMAALDGEGA